MTENDICAQEPIHIPGAILPHGALLVVDDVTLEVLQAAGDLPGLLGVTAAELLGRSLDIVFRPLQLAHLRAVAGGYDLQKPRHLLDPVLRVTDDRPLDASLHRSDGCLVLEFEEADLDDRFAADPLAGVQEMVRDFDQAASLRGLCQMAAERVRRVAAYDRVLVYRFMPDGSGWVIAESMAAHLEPFLDLHYPAADIPQQARALYVKSWLRLITEVNYDPAQLTPTLNPRTGRPLDMSHAVLRDVSPIHREYLRNMGIDASMSISIIRGGALWGLIACHNYSPRRLPRHLRAVCELFGSMFSLQLEGREKSEEFGVRLSSRTVLQNLMLNLASADDYATGLTKESPNLLDYIHGGAATLEGTIQGGVAVSVKGLVTLLGTTPGQAQIADLILWLNSQIETTEGIFATDRLGEVWPPARQFASLASGLLVISVSPEPSDFIIWFRPELVGTTSWAGEPIKHASGGADPAALSPRKSFEMWKETVRGRCLAWTQGDLDAAFDLRVSLLHVVLRRITAAARERKRAAERDQLLMAELDHRVKNTIANIQALVSHTSRSADTLLGFVEGLDGRIQAMAKAHSLLSQSRWEGVSIDRLLREELDPYRAPQIVITLQGPEVVLSSNAALALSLTVHELATNAAKFGSLSGSVGKLALVWGPGEGGGVALSWTESGGRPVQPPTRQGFGSKLIELALAMEVGGRAELMYLRGGVVCKISLPAGSVQNAAGIVTQAPSTVPLAVLPKPPAAASKDPAYRILVVEDSFMLVMALEDTLSMLGWTMVGPANRLADAMKLAVEAEFDAALLDVNLNGEMSWEAARLLKARGKPFVFSTGYNSGTTLPADLAGSVVIAKPYDVDVLEQRLRQVIESSLAA